MMHSFYLLVPILISIVGAICLHFIKIKQEKLKKILSFSLVLLTSIFSLLLVFFPPANSINLIRFSNELQVFFKFDGLGRLFALMVSILWPFAYAYALAYMKHEDRKEEYYTFYIICFGIVLGICYAGNLITMYFFYELLTLITLPLISHQNTKEAKRAGRLYLYVSLFGSAMAFIGLVILQTTTHSTDFVKGGLLDMTTMGEKKHLLWIAYLLTFFGFGVKAAIVPFHFWLPRAGVAPTPTTALLHAVAVVKAGAFAIMRSVYYNFGCDFLKGSYAQTIMMIVVILTIVYNSSMAVKQLHLKRRLAYSTAANISYILLGVSLMSEAGLEAAWLHMYFHSFSKIALFFAVGFFMEKANIVYLDDLNGIYKRMPWTMAFFLLAGFSLIGIPGFSGFISKWYLATAAIETHQGLAYVGIAALLLSAMLTAIYIITILIHAYAYPPIKSQDKIKESDWGFMIPIATFSILSFVLGLFGNPLIQFLFNLLNEVI